MQDCLFCKIIAGDIAAGKIWEDEGHYAFFDLFPNCKGQALVIPKKHFDSRGFEMDDHSFSELLVATKSVAGILKKSFKVERVGMIMEGMGVNHAHIKLYPMHGLAVEWKQQEKDERTYFENYPGYLTTQMGEMLTEEQIYKLIDTIQKND